MLAILAKRFAPALLAVATLSLSGFTFSNASLAQSAPTAQALDPAAATAARDFLQAIGFKSSFEAKLPAVARNKIALKVMLEHEPKLEEQVANVYAARFSADELRAAGAFYRTTTGTLYATFNREIAANPYVTPEIVRAEIAKRFTTQQRGDVFTYLSGGVGKKMIGILPDLLKAEKEVTEQWGAAPKKTSTARSVPAKKSPDLGVMRKRSPAGNLPAGRSFVRCKEVPVPSKSASSTAS